MLRLLMGFNLIQMVERTTILYLYIPNLHEELLVKEGVLIGK